ncbi:MAG TPA: thiamine pyrophosphate-dependent enzyme, partial [Dehalococcoidia bacterium]|nr:thiamine pyrophosphate-dependent enzyme [Dehalococcoidia bacterium]
AAQHYQFRKPRRFVSSGGLGTMGFEVPAAMGAQAADPSAEVWSIAGDGGFQMTMQELATIIDEKQPIKFAIMNNGYLGMVRQWQELFYKNNLVDVRIAQPDFVKLAEAYGIPALRVEDKGDVRAAIDEARAYQGPFIIDFRVEEEGNVWPMVPAGASLFETIEGVEDLLGSTVS